MKKFHAPRRSTMPLSDASIRQAKSSEKVVRLYDSGGLYLEVTPSGSKLWRWKFRIAGKERRLALGTYPATGLKEARQRRDQAKGQLEAGTDPSAAKRADKLCSQDQAANSFEKVAIEWLHVKKHEWVLPRFYGHFQKSRCWPKAAFMHKRRKFSQEFKRGAVEQGRGCELGIRETLSARWKREAEQQGATAFKGSGAPRDEKLAAVKREISPVKKERDFLRKAATFFAKTSS
jgi:transposase-like protein